MPMHVIRTSLVFFSLSGGLLLLSAGSVRGNPGRLPAASVIEDSIPRLGRIAHSPDQLLLNALARLENRDTLGLMLMCPNPEQFRAIYKKMPEAKKAGEVQLNFAKEFYYMDNGKLLARSLGKYSGKNIELISWKTTSPPVLLDGGGRILRDLEIWIKDPETHSEEKMAFVQSIYVDPEGCKIWGFQDHKAGSDAKK